MKIILWIGNEANQKALANKIHAVFPLTGIVTETKALKRKISLKILFAKAIEKFFLPSIGKSWWGMKTHYDKSFKNYPNVETIDVENINSDEAFEFSKKLDADLILVSGTRLIKDKMLSLNPDIGILNLHTGLSPYIKGGPNCTNWCIATKQFHLIGNTVMWIDLGIDTGNILTTERTQFTGDENLSNIHLKVMEHAHELYLKAIKDIENGNRRSVPQNEITDGKTYFTKEWTLRKKISLILNMKRFKREVISSSNQNKISVLEIPNSEK